MGNSAWHEAQRFVSGCAASAASAWVATIVGAAERAAGSGSDDEPGGADVAVRVPQSGQNTALAGNSAPQPVHRIVCGWATLRPPQVGQNCAATGLGLPHDWHISSAGGALGILEPHSGQKAASGGMS